MSRYINPYTDFGFKKLFGEEANKDLLIDFLNAVLPPENKIAHLEFRNSEQLPDNIVDRKAVFDIACTGENGQSFILHGRNAEGEATLFQGSRTFLLGVSDPAASAARGLEFQIESGFSRGGA